MLSRHATTEPWHLPKDFILFEERVKPEPIILVKSTITKANNETSILNSGKSRHARYNGMES